MAFLDIHHLAKVKTYYDSTPIESYFLHMVFAWRLSFALAYLAVVGLIHGVFPIIFTNTVSSNIAKLNEVLEE